MDETVASEQVQSMLESHPLVRRAVLFDLFSGSPLPSGKKSLAYRVELESDEATLGTEQINQAISELLAALKTAVGAAQRA